MERSDFAVGDRLLVQTYYSSTDPIEVTVLEIAQKAVKVRYASGGETWEVFQSPSTNDDVEHWTLLERLPNGETNDDATDRLKLPNVDVLR